MYRTSEVQLRRRKGSESEINPDTSYVIHQDSSQTSFNQEYYGFNGGTVSDAMVPSRSACSRDRTQEFLSAVGSLENGRFRHPAAHHQDQKGQLTRRSAEFMTIAKSISKDIANTYTKLQKLTLLAKRKTIFDDKPQEIQQLTFIIKEDMNCLNRQIGQLQQIAKNQQLQVSKGRHQATHSSSVVVTLQSKLATMTSEFKNVLQVRTENLKMSQSRQQQFSQDALTTSLPQSAVNGFHSGSLLAAMEDDERAAAAEARGGDAVISMDNVQAMAKQDHVTESYLQSRADTMQSIESTIVDLGGIFQQLAHMIKEQEEVMMRIDGHVEDTAMNVDSGHQEILKYFQSVTSNRWLMVKIFGVLIFFFIFFVIFMA